MQEGFHCYVQRNNYEPLASVQLQLIASSYRSMLGAAAALPALPAQPASALQLPFTFTVHKAPQPHPFPGPCTTHTITAAQTAHRQDGYPDTKPPAAHHRLEFYGGTLVLLIEQAAQHDDLHGRKQHAAAGTTGD